MVKLYIYVFIGIQFLVVITTSKIIIEEEQKIKCANGKSPLLDESSLLFPCSRGCPHTFYCEKQNLVSLCCPNLTEITQQKPISGSANREIDAASNLVLPGEKPIDFEFQSSQEIENSISCERYPYRESCEGSDSQPQAKWYFDIQTLSCEVYPFGVCKDDPIAQFALRNREECEQKCDVEKVKNAIGNLKENTVEDASLERTTVEPIVFGIAGRFKPSIPTESSKYSQIGQIAIDDVRVESKHLRNRGFAIEPPTDLLPAIHIPSDAHFLRREVADDGELLTGPTSTSEPQQTVTSDILTVVEEATEVSENPEEGSGSEEKETDELNGGGGDGGEKVDIQQESTTSRRKSLKSMEDSFERFYKQNKEVVVCQKTDYKLLCNSGKPTQFVYRWELVNGVCQSFPFGYCLYESNVAHPRTKEECETFCK